MIIVLDASAAINLAIAPKENSAALKMIKKAEWIIAPDIFLSEVANTSWKYYHFEKMSLTDCEYLIRLARNVVDDFIESAAMIDEVFNLACQTNHPVYDILYLVLARRFNGFLLSKDKKLNGLAKRLSIRIAE